MTTLPAAGYISAPRTNAEQKVAVEAVRAFVAERTGGSAETELTIASGSVTPTTGHHSIDTQGDASTDDLANILQTNLADGSWLSIRCADNARAVVVKHAATGDGQIFLKDSVDLTLDATTKHLMLRRSGAAWYEVFRFNHVPTPAAADAGKAPMVSSAGAVVLAGPMTGSRRNLLDNGSMLVAQRGTSVAGVGASSTQVAIDRWTLQSFSSASARWTISKENAGGVSGKAPWMKLLCTTADASPGADEAQAVYQKVEAQNLYARMFEPSGTWRASKLSFDVVAVKDAASSIAFPATLCVFAQSQDGTARTLVATFTVAAAGVWQRVSIDIPADATISVDNDSGAGMTIGWGLYGGSSRQGTANAWATPAQTVTATAASANLADAANNYLGLANVQWEVGSVATPFEHPDAADEWRRCRRWLRHFDYSTVSGENITHGYNLDTTTTRNPFVFGNGEPMRTAPSVSVGTVASFAVAHSGGSTSCTNVTIGEVGTYGCNIIATVASGLTAGGGNRLTRDGTDSGCTLTLSAE